MAAYKGMGRAKAKAKTTKKPAAKKSTNRSYVVFDELKKGDTYFDSLGYGNNDVFDTQAAAEDAIKEYFEGGNVDLYDDDERSYVVYELVPVARVTGRKAKVDLSVTKL